MNDIVKTEDEVPIDVRWEHLRFFDIVIASINLLPLSEYNAMIAILQGSSSGMIRAVCYHINEGFSYDTSIIRYFFDDETHMALFKLQFSTLRYVTIPHPSISNDK